MFVLFYFSLCHFLSTVLPLSLYSTYTYTIEPVLSLLIMLLISFDLSLIVNFVPQDFPNSILSWRDYDSAFVSFVYD